MNRSVETITVTGGHTDEEYLASCPNDKPIPTIIPPVQRIIAMGDIHGDFEVALRMFRTAHLIDEQFRWIAQPPDTVVVQVGDQIDSCRPIPGRFSCDVPATRKEDNQADDLRVMRFFDEMHEKAQRAGGAVYSLLGNHELLNAKGVMTYVSYADGHQFRYQEDGVEYHGLEGRKKAFAPGGPIARSMGCNRTSVLVIGSTLFAHAGILPAISKYFDNSRMVDPDDRLRYINILVSKWLLGIVLPANEERILRLIRDGQDSPFWNRILGDIPYGEKINSPV